MIKVINLNKTINEKLVLKNINFTLEKKAIVGILGRNDTGETTLLQSLFGILFTDSIAIFYDADIVSHPMSLENMFITTLGGEDYVA